MVFATPNLHQWFLVRLLVSAPRGRRPDVHLIGGIDNNGPPCLDTFDRKKKVHDVPMMMERWHKKACSTCRRGILLPREQVTSRFGTVETPRRTAAFSKEKLFPQLVRRGHWTKRTSWPTFANIIFNTRCRSDQIDLLVFLIASIKHDERDTLIISIKVSSEPNLWNRHWKVLKDGNNL